MALQTIIEGVHEIYLRKQDDETASPCKKDCVLLLPQVNVKRLSPQVIEKHTASTPLQSTTEIKDYMSLFEEENTYPFLGFGQYGEPTVQLPTRTRSLKRDLETPAKTDSEKPNKKRKIVKRKRKHPIVKGIHKSPVPRPRSKMPQKSPCEITSKPTPGLESIRPGNRNVTAENSSFGNSFGHYTSADIPDLEMAIKDEIDDDDITIEDEDFDYSYNVSERNLSPPDERLNNASHGNLDSETSLNNNHTLPSEDLSNRMFCGNSVKNSNGLTQPTNLTELTTLLLELNNKNNNLDKKLAKLKQAYEIKAAKIQEEKQVNEKTIQETLQTIQKWRDNPEASGDSRLASPSKITSDHSWHRGDIVLPVLQDSHYMQQPVSFVHRSREWYVPGHQVPLSPPQRYYHWTEEGDGLDQVSPRKIHLEEGDGLDQVSPRKIHLEEGDNVKMKHSNGGKKWKKATVIAPCSYLVRDYKGQVYRRSFKHLVRAQQKPYVVIPAQSSGLLAFGSSEDESSLKSGRGRVIKKRERLNL